MVKIGWIKRKTKMDYFHFSFFCINEAELKKYTKFNFYDNILDREKKERKMHMKILTIGDIVGENGVKKFKEELPKIRAEHNIDFVIVNAENSAGGMGITTKIFNDILNQNVDAITMGNHTWGKKDIFSFIDHPKLLRPANYSKGVVGKGYGIYTCNNKKIGVIDLIGRTDMIRKSIYCC